MFDRLHKGVEQVGDYAVYHTTDMHTVNTIVTVENNNNYLNRQL